MDTNSPNEYAVWRWDTPLGGGHWYCRQCGEHVKATNPTDHEYDRKYPSACHDYISWTKHYEEAHPFELNVMRDGK